MKNFIGPINGVFIGPDDYIGPDSMTQWIIEVLMGFTDLGLLVCISDVYIHNL